MAPQASVYQFPNAADLEVGEDEEEEAAAPAPEQGGEAPKAQSSPGAAEKPSSPFDYAKIQADALMEEARRDVEAYKQQSRAAFEQQLAKELDAARRSAREEGYNRGFAEGMADAAKETKQQREQQAKEQLEAVRAFLEQAARLRDRLLDESREELKDLALAVAEKVIRVSLRGSSDILRRMIESATDKHKRCEWAHIYIADCDVRTTAGTIPELAKALSHVSDRVRVIPMVDDESGTCIIEMPDEILDASVSTQLGNIREALSNAALDAEG